ncbi:carbohydrate ABC transporter permease [Isoptericola sp. F-RaC21]|uniref:carbohydrate ABC transporter permease n=1 Tax=Isoptericola sp. F-RaC21 TaxID=3141452 RepID=UPI00315B59DD
MAAVDTIPASHASQTPPARAVAVRSRAVRSTGWHLFMLLALVALLFPLAWLVSASFKSSGEIFTTTSFWPQEFTPANWTDALDGAGGLTFWQLLANSLILSTLTVIGNVASCALAGYALARMRFRLRGPFFAFTIVTLMLPMHVVLIPQYIIFQQLGLIGTFLPLVLPKFLATEGFFVFLVIQFVRGIPRELDEAALVDGAGPYRTFFSVILPLIRPALITTAIFSFIWSWNDFFGQMIFLNKPETYTLQLGLRLFIDQSSTSSYGPMFAMSVLALLPILLFFLVFQRYLVDGVATSGLKG